MSQEGPTPSTTTRDSRREVGPCGSRTLNDTLAGIRAKTRAGTRAATLAGTRAKTRAVPPHWSADTRDDATKARVEKAGVA